MRAGPGVEALRVDGEEQDPLRSDVRVAQERADARRADLDLRGPAPRRASRHS